MEMAIPKPKQARRQLFRGPWLSVWSLILGVLFFTASAIGGNLTNAFVSLGAFVAFAAVFYFGGARNETLGGLSTRSIAITDPPLPARDTARVLLLILVALCIATFLLGRAIGWWAIASGLIVGVVIANMADNLEGDVGTSLGFVFGTSTFLAAAVGAVVRQRSRIR